jgi:hypothetical protein
MSLISKLGRESRIESTLRLRKNGTGSERTDVFPAFPDSSEVPVPILHSLFGCSSMFRSGWQSVLRVDIWIRVTELLAANQLCDLTRLAERSWPWVSDQRTRPIRRQVSWLGRREKNGCG